MLDNNGRKKGLDKEEKEIRVRARVERGGKRTNRQRFQNAQLQREKIRRARWRDGRCGAVEGVRRRRRMEEGMCADEKVRLFH